MITFSIVNNDWGKVVFVLDSFAEIKHIWWLILQIYFKFLPATEYKSIVVMD